MMLVTVCDLKKRVVIYKIVLKIDEKKREEGVGARGGGECNIPDGLGMIGLFWH